MSYIELINAFEKWLETNHLPSLAQLLWYKLIHIFNRAGWCEWITVDNRRLMALIDINREATFIATRNKLIDAGLFEYQKGKKGCPNKYKICTSNFENIYESKKIVKSNLYSYFLDKYKSNERNFAKQIKIVSQMRNDEKWDLLNDDEQLKIQSDIFS